MGDEDHFSFPETRSLESDLPDEPWYEMDPLRRQRKTLIMGFNSDLRVLVQDQTFRCHAYILSIASPKLNDIIRSNPQEFKLLGVKAKNFRFLLQIMYSGEADDELQTDVEKILDVTRDALELQIYSAMAYCTKLTRNRLDASCVCAVLDLARLVDDKELTAACTKVIQSQTDEVLKSDGFLKCDVATLELILQQEAVHNVTELDMFQALAAWAKKRQNPREALGSTLSLIRFRTFTSKAIATCVKPTKLLTDAEENALLWYFMAGGEGELPDGFSTEENEREKI